MRNIRNGIIKLAVAFCFVMMLPIITSQETMAKEQKLHNPIINPDTRETEYSYVYFG